MSDEASGRYSKGTRWMPSRKAQLIEDIKAGRIGRLQALRQHGLSEEELRSWENRANIFGKQGLRTTRVQDYREAEDATAKKA